MGEGKFRWEEAFQSTWDTGGGVGDNFTLNVSRRTENLQRGIVRRVLLVLDVSSSVEERDFLPSRKYYVKKAASKFFRSFTESNPLSTMGVAVAYGGSSYLGSSTVCEEGEIEALLGQAEGGGGFSLGSALETAGEFFEGCSFVKEVVFVVSSLSFSGRDPVGIKNALVNRGVIMHTIHLAGEVEILRRVSEESGGVFGVVNSPEDLGALLGLVCVPPPHSAPARLSMLRVGFPAVICESTLCSCHLRMNEWGYECPFCTTKVCSIPGVCPICENILSAAVHLLKALHWSDSAPVFVPGGRGKCRGCGEFEVLLHECPSCRCTLCGECTGFVRQELNFCIFCP
ncbi:transcription initiation factor TFIIH subunit 2 [Nematocida major]|uniref:transcription initiation factor TFIIH subunit 2 n=1 Tax=Nematocida major TaxID=1912982 RepID=UPI002008ABBE|nr:transcription initiation factor TFIIH subunit 2 [Nematocida major]KAH9387404.1 transcription initiation factor TFIIH subunit 2 [Nematocida major]